MIRFVVINFATLFCTIECLHLGLLSPIEVVEEFGCHDTELRLTCGNLDSKLAILEATFAPNCTEDECLRIDMKRLVRTFALKETEDIKNAEKIAGQKFLETLRQSHSDDEDIDVDVFENSYSVDEKTFNDTKVQKKKNIPFRLVLERLIIRYLHQISSEDESDDNSFLRSRRNILPNGVNETIKDLGGSSEEAERIRMETETGSQCEEQRRLISSLNRLDLEKSFRNQSDNEYNIRRVLNKRCSGKNHCSFIFAADHPFAKVWQSGVVRLKYICMEDFRINRYCGEHLTIGYEIDPNVKILEAGNGEPIAEARIQPRETSLHSLKIIKADKSTALDSSRNITTASQESRKIKIAPPIKNPDDESAGHKRVYSQDFRVLKILPSNLDDFNDIETIGDEIYFRKEESSTVESNVSEQSSTPPNYEPITAFDALDENIVLNLTKISDNDNSILDNVTLTIREGGHYVMVYPSLNETLNNVASNLSASEWKYGNEATTSSKDIYGELSSSVMPLSKNSLEEGNNSLRMPSVQSSSGNIKTYNSSQEEDKKKNHNFDGREVNKPQITYNSVQRTSFRPPLLHGFAMTPGYPKFYIGEFECYWNILAPDGIRVLISIIDISLRFDDVCKDFLKIDDIGINRTLFNSCTDAINPIGIISTSNWVKITIKTTSKFAYPKRGVLLHYTADGCVNPPLPSNVKLVDRTATTAFYKCHPSFLFPDSGQSTRKLTCNNIHVWDKLLPNCIEQENLYRSTPTEDKLTLLNKKPDLSIITNIMPSPKDADMMFDILIPSVLIAGLFVINGVVFAIIMKYRKSGFRLIGVSDGNVTCIEINAKKNVSERLVLVGLNDLAR